MSSRSSLIPSVVIVIIVFASIGGLLFISNPYEPARIAIVVMEPGRGDLSFVDQSYEGIEEVLGVVSISPSFSLVGSESEAETELKRLAQTGQYQLIIALGRRLSSALENAAVAYPNQYFALIGGNLDLDNIASAIFEPADGGFLAGVIAAFLAADPDIKRDFVDPIVGIIASVESDPTIQDLVEGFRLGLVAANESYNLNVKLLPVEYLGGYNETQEAETKSYSMWTEDDATVIFAPVRAAIIGIRNGALRANETHFGFLDKMPLIIAAERNQDYYGCSDINAPYAPSWIATSVVLRTDLSIFNIVNKTLWNEFPSNGLFIYNLTRAGPYGLNHPEFISPVNITNLQYSSTYITNTTITAFRFYHESIVNGTLEVP